MLSLLTTWVIFPEFLILIGILFLALESAFPRLLRRRKLLKLCRRRNAHFERALVAAEQTEPELEVGGD